MPRDCELMVHVRAGDVQAFEVLVKRHRDRVRNFVYRLSWDWEEAADCTQEAFIRLWRRRAEYVPRTQFTTYLYTIARSCWLDHRRRRDSRPQTIPLDAQIGPAAEQLMAQIIGQAEPTVAAVLRRYEVHRIRHALALLPDGQRIVFILSHFEDLRYAQIAEILRIPVGTVKSRMHYAVSRLRELLSETEEASENEL